MACSDWTVISRGYDNILSLFDSRYSKKEIGNIKLRWSNNNLRPTRNKPEND